MFKTIKLYFLLIIICLIGLTQLSCRQQTITVVPDTESSNPMVKVEIDVFSGKPNPGWELTIEEADKLSELIDSLTAIDKFNPPSSTLGFRGFIVYNLELNSIDLNMHITVIGNIVSVYDIDGHQQDFHDKEKAVFNFLQMLSAKHLDTNLYEAIFN